MMFKFNTKFFFDSKHVKNRVDKKTRKVLIGVGSFTRRKLRSRMRSGGKSNIVSKEGEYPRSHGARLLRDNIFFQFDPKRETVVTGPRRLRWKPQQLKHKPFSGGSRTVIRPRLRSTLPEFINEGGTALAITELESGRSVRKTITYGPRPFVALATPEAIAELREKTRTVDL